MTQIWIGKEGIREFGIYKEDDVLVLGVRLVPQAQYESLIFQIETKRDQRFERWGMHSEINGRGSYGLVKNFSFDPQRSRLMVDLEDKLLVMFSDCHLSYRPLSTIPIVA